VPGARSEQACDLTSLIQSPPVATLCVSAGGDLAPWEVLDPAEQGFYTSLMAEEIVEHMCRYWLHVATLEFLFEPGNGWHIPDQS